MSYARYAILIALFTATSVLAQGGGIPKAPVNLKAAETQGLQRLSVEDLKAFIPGTHEVKGTKGKCLKIFKPDGSFQREGFKDYTGTWRFDEGKNAYCLAVNKPKGQDKSCFAVFRAPQGDYFFEYDLEDGFYAHTWQPAKCE